MPIFQMMQRAYQGYGTKNWHSPMMRLAIGFFGGWLGCWFFEPGNPLVEIRNYYWYVFETGTTLGYGELYPTTLGGRLSCMFMGGMTIWAIGKFLSISGANRRRREEKRLKGKLKVNPKDIKLPLVLVFGYHQGGQSQTELIINEMLTGETHQVVLVEQSGFEHPCTEYNQTRLHYVTADRLYSDQCMHETCARLAKSVIINVEQPFQALAITKAVRRVNPQAHIVVALDNIADADGFSDLDGVVCLHRDYPVELASEACAPHTSNIMTEFLTRGGPAMHTFQVGPAIGTGAVSYERIDAFIHSQRGILVAITDPYGNPVQDIFTARAGAGWWVGYIRTGEIPTAAITAQLLNV